LPDVKTMSEQGIKFDVAAYYAFVAPAGVPKEIIGKLNKAINEVLVMPETVEKLRAMGFAEMPIKTPEEFNEMIASDRKTWADIVRNGNIKVD
jgi:tripartite-type tricarboxylate transporter receptor subunit TctC